MSTITVRGEKLIARPIDVVQSQFADMAHHERAKVHSALGIHDAAPIPNGFRFTGRRRMLGAMQEDITEVVRSADGNSELRVVSGPNVGLVVRQTFEAQGPDRTLARIEVAMPARGVLKLLAPLVRIGIKLDVAKALEEDRIDLEERGYTPS